MKSCPLKLSRSVPISAISVVFAVLISVGSLLATEKVQQEGSLLVLPPKIYAVEGKSIALYYDNLVLTKDSSKCQFSTSCEIGHAESGRWVLDGDDLTPETYPLTVTMTDESSNSFEASTEVIVSAPQSPINPLSLLIVGDSLTHASHYSNCIAEHLNQLEGLQWKMLGTHQPSTAAKGIRHEGYGGKTWSWFLEHHEPEPDGTHRKRSSPFVFMQSNGQPKLDLKKYFQQTSGGEKPDVITILLGINDCFTASANPDKLAAKKIEALFENADRLVQEFRKACPNAKIGLCVTPPPNRRPEAFVASYQQKYPREGWTQVLQQLQKEQIRRWGHSECDHVSLIPIHLNLDTTAGYPETNAVHPNKIGYRQIGDSIYAWICAHQL